MNACWTQLNTLAERVPGIVPKLTAGSNEYKVRLYPRVLTAPSTLATFTALFDGLLRLTVRQ